MKNNILIIYEYSIPFDSNYNVIKDEIKIINTLFQLMWWYLIITMSL